MKKQQQITTRWRQRATLWALWTSPDLILLSCRLSRGHATLQLYIIISLSNMNPGFFSLLEPLDGIYPNAASDDIKVGLVLYVLLSCLDCNVYLGVKVDIQNFSLSFFFYS